MHSSNTMLPPCPLRRCMKVVSLMIYVAALTDENARRLLSSIRLAYWYDHVVRGPGVTDANVASHNGPNPP
jgi:hypothetical protein